VALDRPFSGWGIGERSAFALGLVVRLGLLIGVPVTYGDWFLPFLAHAGAAATLDPWTGFLSGGGDPMAFPYGPIYLLVFLPATWLGGLLSPRAAAVGLGLTILLLDFLLFAAVRRLVGTKQRSFCVYAYWLSPIVIYVNYWHGQLDALPVLILSLALLMLRRNQFTGAGLTLGLAGAAKMSMAVAVPFVWIYVTAARRLRSHAARLIVATLAGLATMLPFILSDGFQRMVLRTPEREKVFSLVIPFGGLDIYVMPLVLAALVFTAWRIRRFNFDVLFSIVGIGFFVLVLLTPASPGWGLWLVPFLAVHICRAGSMGRLAGFAFAALFVIFHVLTSTGSVWPIAAAGFDASPRLLNMALSLYLAAGGMVAMQILQDGLLRNPFYRATRSPLAIAIAGDSGAGKDTLADALHGLFGRSTTALLSGDDYHSWDRINPMWRSLTHLNPKANDLRRFNADILALKSGRPVEVPHYDHKVGRMTKPHSIGTADVVICSGLHALYSPDANAAFDLRIFLSMDEELRQFLKLRRDVRDRGHSVEAVRASMARRQADSIRYIRPQADAADVMLSLVPRNRRALAEPMSRNGPVAMSLHVQGAISAEFEALGRVLASLCGAQVLPLGGESEKPGIAIVGDPSTADIAAAARRLVPHMSDYITMEPIWCSGLLGIMQLVVLDQLGQRLALRKAS